MDPCQISLFSCLNPRHIHFWILLFTCFDVLFRSGLCFCCLFFFLPFSSPTLLSRFLHCRVANTTTSHQADFWTSTLTCRSYSPVRRSFQAYSLMYSRVLSCTRTYSTMWARNKFQAKRHDCEIRPGFSRR